MAKKVVSPHYSEIATAIRREQFARAMRTQDIAEMCGKSKSTLYAQMNAPWKITIGDLLAYCRVLEIDPVALMQKVMAGVV